MPGSGMSILRRLFLSPVTIASYSPDARYRRREERVTNCGEEVCPEIAKTSLIDFSLAYSIGKLYALGASGAQRRFFGQKSDPNMQFGCRAQKLMHYSGQYFSREEAKALR